MTVEKAKAATALPGGYDIAPARDLLRDYDKTTKLIKEQADALETAKADVNEIMKSGKGLKGPETKAALESNDFLCRMLPGKIQMLTEELESMEESAKLHLRDLFKVITSLITNQRDAELKKLKQSLEPFFPESYELELVLGYLQRRRGLLSSLEFRASRWCGPSDNPPIRKLRDAVENAAEFLQNGRFDPFRVI